MGELFVRKLTPQDRIDVCDKCGQEGVYANGKEVKDTHNEVVVWFCYNCTQQVLS